MGIDAKGAVHPCGQVGRGRQTSSAFLGLRFTGCWLLTSTANAAMMASTTTRTPSLRVALSDNVASLQTHETLASTLENVLSLVYGFNVSADGIVASQCSLLASCKQGSSSWVRLHHFLSLARGWITGYCSLSRNFIKSLRL